MTNTTEIKHSKEDTFFLVLIVAVLMATALAFAALSIYLGSLAVMEEGMRFTSFGIFGIFAISISTKLVMLSIDCCKALRAERAKK